MQPLNLPVSEVEDMDIVGPDGSEVGGWTDGVGVAGYIDLAGTQYYDNYEVVSTNPAQGNYYW